MRSYFDAASVAAVPRTATEPRLRQLLAEAVAHWEASDLLALTHLLVLEPGDTEEAVVSESGFSPLVNPLDGARFGTPSFKPFWDALRDRGGWFELIMTVGNGGFAFVLFIKDDDDLDPELLALCRTYAGGER